MKICWFFFLCGMAILSSCTASKFKRFGRQAEYGNYTDRQQLEALSNESAVQQRSVEHVADYDALWWLKGGVRLHADSGIFADEAFIQYQGMEGYQSLWLDSLRHLRTHRLSREEALQSEVSEETREKEKKSDKQWWFAVLVGLLFGWLLLKRLHLSKR